MYVRVDAIGQAGLSAGQMLEALDLSLRELAIAEALCLVHGREAGMARYFEMGGSVRFTSWGDPYVPVRPARRKRLR